MKTSGFTGLLNIVASCQQYLIMVVKMQPFDFDCFVFEDRKQGTFFTKGGGNARHIVFQAYAFKIILCRVLIKRITP